MKKLTIENYKIDNDITKVIADCIQEICNCDMAIAEPFSMNLPWWASSLITSMSECYFDNSEDTTIEIVGICCKDKSTIQIFLQNSPSVSYELDAKALAANLDSNEYVVFFLEV